MRIAVFSDIHGNLQALESIFRSIKKNNIDKTICLGDVIGLGPCSKECLDLIIKKNIEMVLGNHELYCIYGTNIDKNISNEEKKHHDFIRASLTSENINYLKKCKLQITEEDILFEHFLLDNELQYPFLDISIINNIETVKIDNKFIFVGHDHNGFIKNNKIIGIGSSGCTKDDITSYYIIDTSNYSYKIIKINYERDNLKHVLNKNDYPDKEFIANNFFGIK